MGNANEVISCELFITNLGIVRPGSLTSAVTKFRAFQPSYVHTAMISALPISLIDVSGIINVNAETFAHIHSHIYTHYTRS